MKKELFHAVFAVLFCSLLFAPPRAFGEESTSGPFKLSAFGTYGVYQSSRAKDYIGFQWFFADYVPSEGSGVGLNYVQNFLVLRRPLFPTLLPTYTSQYMGGSLYHSFQAGSSSVGLRASMVNIKSDDANSDATNVTYGQVSWKTDDGLYADIGLAGSPYRNSMANQYSLTGGVSFLGGAIQSQTRVFYFTLSNPLQGKNSAVAVEERLIMAPSRNLFFVATVTPGEKFYAYMPEINYTNNSADLQKGSASFSANYGVTQALLVSGAVSWESYWNKALNNGYAVTYWTLGLTYRL